MFPHSIAASLVVVCTATACSPGPMPVSQSPRDPSNPAAAEGVVPPVAAGASAPTEGSQGTHSQTVQDSQSHQHDHSSHRASGSAGGAQVQATDAGVSAIYVCPMHPEVTSSAPGRCPKCGMNLVPKK